MLVVKMNEFEARGDPEVEIKKLYSKSEIDGNTLIGDLV